MVLDALLVQRFLDDVAGVASQEPERYRGPAEAMGHAGDVDALASGIDLAAEHPMNPARIDALDPEGLIGGRVQGERDDHDVTRVRAPIRTDAEACPARFKSLLASRTHNVMLASAAQRSQSRPLRAVVENAR